MGSLRLVQENEDPLLHLAEARSIVHPSMSDSCPDPSWWFAYNIGRTLGPDVDRWRETILNEIDQLRDGMSDEIDEWWLTLPPHVQIAYDGGGQRKHMNDSCSPAS